MMLGNIAGDGPQARDFLLAQRCVDIIGHVVASSQGEALAEATRCLSNLVRGRPSPTIDHIRPAMPLLANLLHNEAVAANALWALSYISDDEARARMLMEAGVVPQVMRYLSRSGAEFKATLIPALRTVGNILTGDDFMTQMMINLGVIPILLGLTSHSNRSIQKEALWALSNISAGTNEQQQALIDAGAMPALERCLGKHVPAEVSKEAMWVVCNMSTNSSEERAVMLATTAYPNIETFLHAPDARMTMVALEFLENTLSAGGMACLNMVEEIGILSVLEELQGHPNQRIYEAAARLLTEHFDADGEDDGAFNGEPHNVGDFSFAPDPSANSFNF
eukprot:TRINITY_DN790_c0_g2_i1.p1 TRINITY_DN790_c0_g2~~TRINITY_DN790_c0_g2_i1.p1  ORF type:complete len:336 (-),score=84.40 TRINITY_DN790_c0_g2_i1:324-1331(-)